MKLSKIVYVLYFLSFWGNLNLAQQNLLSNDLDFQKPKNGQTYVIAHRGVHIDIPENTIAAYKKAIEIGCDFIEIDVRRTKDGRFVSIHDSKIDKYVKGKKGNVNSFTLNKLQKLNIGQRTHHKWKNERIPTLESILQLCKGKIGIYLDLKEPFVKEIAEIIIKYKMEREIVWYIATSYQKAILELKESCTTCLPMPDPGPFSNLLNIIKEIHPFFIATDMKKLTSNFVKIAHNNNAKVFVDESVGNEKEWENIIKIETDGIQTDDPERLIKYLNTNK